MEQMKRKLEELGVIGRVFDDFNPFVELILFYDSSGERAIKLGDEVTYPEVHSEPTLIEYNGDTPEYFQTFESGQSILMVMSDFDATGGAEYLQWVIIYEINDGEDEEEALWCELEPVAYKPPRPSAENMMFTIFKVKNVQSIQVPNRRENFSTREFAESNGLGPPLGASLLKVKQENEDHEDGDRPFKKRKRSRKVADLP